MVNTLTKVNKECWMLIHRLRLCLYTYVLEFVNCCRLLFQSWDLVQQTQNYLKLLLHIINSDGKLLHFHKHFRRTIEQVLLVCIILDNYFVACR